MRRRRFTVYNTLAPLQWVFGFLSTGIGASLRVQEPRGVSRWSPLSAELLAAMRENAWIALPVLLVLIGLLETLKKVFSPPWVWDTTHELLDDFRQHVFCEEHGAPMHHHRATLFRFSRWRWRCCKWPWAGWLIPVERSGHTTFRGIPAFLAPDDADKAEGIAGQTWAQNGVVHVHSLPDLHAGAADDEVSEYARKTWTTVDWVRREKPHARSFCGIPVEVKGKMWGVIVLDSRSEHAIATDAAETFRLIGRYFGRILERA